MNQVVWSFEVFGFRVQVGLLFIFMALLVSTWMPLQTAPEIMLSMLVVFASVIIHELGHAFVARRFGLWVGDIQLHGLGGQVPHARTTPGRQLWISLAGPGAGLAVGFATLALAVAFEVPPAFTGVLTVILWVNIGWSLFNLLPVLPLDGGHALQSGLSLVMSTRNAVRIAAVSTMVLGIAGLYLGATSGMLFLAVMAMLAGYHGYTTYQSVA